MLFYFFVSVESKKVQRGHVVFLLHICVAQVVCVLNVYKNPKNHWTLHDPPIERFESV